MVKAVIFDFYNTLAETDELRPVVGRARRRARLFRCPTTSVSAGGTTASTGPSTTSTRSRVTTTSPGSSRGCGRCSPSAALPAPAHDEFMDRVARDRRAQPHRRVSKRSPTCSATCGSRGVALAICSNWDWDLHEAVESAGLTGTVDIVVSSAWVGARKPHPRIYRHTLEQLGRRARGRALRRRHLDLRRRRPARRGHADDLPPPVTSRCRPHGSGTGPVPRRRTPRPRSPRLASHAALRG